jgi:hypothetical protein
MHGVPRLGERTDVIRRFAAMVSFGNLAFSVAEGMTIRRAARRASR